MRRAAVLSLFALASAACFAGVPTKYEGGKLRQEIDLTHAEKVRVSQVDHRYAPEIKHLLSASHGEVTATVDSLNREYTGALLQGMSPIHQKQYLDAVYHTIQDDLMAHPGKKLNQIFVLGGTFGKKPGAPTPPVAAAKLTRDGKCGKMHMDTIPPTRRVR